MSVTDYTQGPYQLQKNPQLSDTPQGAWEDSTYAAAIAQLRAQTMKQYSDVLGQLGWKDPTTGSFIPGTVEADADRQRAGLQSQISDADKQVIGQHQQEGTYFSGLLGQDIAAGEHPYVSAIADLDVNTPRALSALYKQGVGLLDDYTQQQNMLLAQAAQRQAALAQLAQGGAPDTTGAGTTSTDGSTAPPAAAPPQGLYEPDVASGGRSPTAGVPAPTASGYYDPYTSKWVPLS